MLTPDAQDLRSELLALFDRGADRPLEDPEFDRLARDVFRYQLDHIAAYAGFCRARGITTDSIRSWREIPAVPAAAFAELRLLADGATAERVFRTSGTTRGPERRGEHHVPDLDLYRRSLRPTFRAALLRDDARLPFLSLVPPPEALPDSSLAFMIDDVTRTFGAHGSRGFATAASVDFDALDAAVTEAASEHRPALLLGTSAAFIHWLDRLAEDGRRHRLPEGSRLMDTGGFKGRGRRVEPVELRDAYAHRLGLDPRACINEYGMTEMLSQLYDRPDGVDRRKVGPPWVRTLAVDPDTLAPLPDGRSGLLRHLDLANLGGVAAIQTEDFGHAMEDGVRLEGRAPGAVPRGCSIAMDLLLGAAP